MWFFVCPNKLKFRKLFCCTIYIHFLMLNIFILFRMLLSVCKLLFNWYILFFLRDIKHHVYVMHLTSVFLNTNDKLTSVFCVAVFTIIFFLKSFTNRYLDSFHQVEDKPFVSSIHDIYNFSTMSCCNDTTVNDYIKGLQ